MVRLGLGRYILRLEGIVDNVMFPDNVFGSCFIKTKLGVL
tara:strand:+ start:1200 stop:1319 length:120 start_codon:yes stop_codon:yes gene_type:complete